METYQIEEEYNLLIDSYDALKYALEETKWRLPNNNKEIDKMSKTPTKHEYEKALEIVQNYEDRQKDLAKLNKDLGHCLQQFDQVKFDVNEGKKEVTFTGVAKDGKLKLTKSVARYNDKFEQVIGKLICVKKALGEDIEYIDKFVERESPFTIKLDANDFIVPKKDIYRASTIANTSYGI